MGWGFSFAIHLQLPTRLGGVSLNKSRDIYEISEYKRSGQPIKSDSLPLPLHGEGQG